MNNELKKALGCGYGLSGDRKSGLPEGYFPHWEYNVYGNEMSERFLSMFNRGSGGELDKKACAVYSSSMLSYNFFHWIDDKHKLPLRIGDRTIEFSAVYFEVQMRTLRTSGSPANMDVLLASDDGRDWLMLESKFTEYLDNEEFGIKESYLKESSYFGEQGAAWVPFVRKIEAQMKGGKRYFGGIKQNICHLIAIRNLLCHDLKAEESFRRNNKVDENEIPMPGHIYFRNLVFKPDRERFTDETKKYDDYFNLWNGFKCSMSESEELALLDVGFMSYSDIWCQMGKTAPDDLKAFLSRRYMQFADIEAT